METMQKRNNDTLQNDLSILLGIRERLEELQLGAPASVASAEKRAQQVLSVAIERLRRELDITREKAGV
jgi:hypothetical protein